MAERTYLGFKLELGDLGESSRSKALLWMPRSRDNSRAGSLDTSHLDGGTNGASLKL